MDNNQKKKKSGVVILTYNNSELVLTLVDRIIEETIFDYIVIVDNCSTDDTSDVLQSAFSDKKIVCLLTSKVNGGYAKGNNLGANELLKHSELQYLFFANPDVIITAQNVEKVIEELRKKLPV